MKKNKIKDNQLKIMAQKSKDIEVRLAKIAGPVPTKLCECRLYLIQENQEQCDLCRILKTKQKE